MSDIRSIQVDVNLMKFDSRKGWDFSHGQLKKRSDKIFSKGTSNKYVRLGGGGVNQKRTQ